VGPSGAAGRIHGSRRGHVGQASFDAACEVAFSQFEDIVKFLSVVHRADEFVYLSDVREKFLRGKQAMGFVAVAIQSGGHQSEKIVHVAEEEIVFVAEVVVERGTADSCAVKNLPDGNGVKGLFLHESDKGVAESVTGAADSCVELLSRRGAHEFGDGFPSFRRYAGPGRFWRRVSGQGRRFCPFTRSRMQTHVDRSYGCFYVRRMTDNRRSSLALVAGSAGMIITMALHPMGRIAPAELEAVVRKLLAVHSVALASIPLLLLGAWGMARRLSGPDRLSWAGLGVFGYAVAAILTGAVFDGLVEPRLLQQIVGTEGPTREVWQTIMKYNGIVDSAFVRVYVVAAGVAILLWSAAVVKNKQLGWGLALYGGLLGLITVIGVLAGMLRPQSHGFALVIVGEALWFLVAGAALWREPRAASGVTA
jgi:hypothetical protein